MFCRLHKLFHSVFVVSAVHDHSRENSFHTSLPACFSESPKNCILRKIYHILENLCSFQRQSRIHYLIPCNKRNGKRCVSIILILHTKINARTGISQNFRIFLFYFIIRTAQSLSLLPNHLGCLRIISVIDHRHSRNNDPCLFSCNLCNGIPQILHMVKADGCDHTGNGILHCCCGIQTSSQSGFQHDIIHTCLGKDHHSHKKQHLKIRGMVTSLCHKLVCKSLYLFKCAHKRLVINILLIDLKAFIDHNQVWRGKKSTGISRLSENGSQKSTGTSFSVGSCHMNDFKLFFRISQTLQTLFCMGEFIFCCKLWSFFNISNRFFVIHKKIHHFI